MSFNIKYLAISFFGILLVGVGAWYSGISIVHSGNNQATTIASNILNQVQQFKKCVSKKQYRLREYAKKENLTLETLDCSDKKRSQFITTGKILTGEAKEVTVKVKGINQKESKKIADELGPGFKPNERPGKDGARLVRNGYIDGKGVYTFLIN